MVTPKDLHLIAAGILGQHGVTPSDLREQLAEAVSHTMPAQARRALFALRDILEALERHAKGGGY
jgi:hypothetical protein